LIEQIPSYRTLFFNIVTTMSYAFSPAMNKLHAAFIKICTSRQWPTVSVAMLKRTTCHFTALTSTVWSPSAFSKYQWISVDSTPLLHTHFHVRCHSVTLPLWCHLSQQQNIMKYWWEGSAYTTIPSMSTSDILCQHHKIGGITFGAEFGVFSWFNFSVDGM